MSLADRLRAHGVSESRIFSIGLASRSGELPDRLDDSELALAAQYEMADAFERVRIRASNPEALERGRTAVKAVDAWVAKRKIRELHGLDQTKSPYEQARDRAQAAVKAMERK